VVSAVDTLGFQDGHSQSELAGGRMEGVGVNASKRDGWLPHVIICKAFS
jgi:hypothetical protein